ncbi:hypothetical protein C1J03_12710 [Sulfitobacter sp. SK012]|uniref:OmpP1/FadL family transporter n=1 Tax=Sulfitobacter sp. SK012 TaxID=1389005 RepID=UPI000E0B6A77|nr:outer membrane protein transport protein [Sulfitobacter sp. SK012]AXI46811.1 hypothetical protein C1J03_12710 [Sulfitobacter sp. SK012]
MKKKLLASVAFSLSAYTAQAGGLDRSGQDIGIIFESGNLFELSFGLVNPSLTGVENGSTLTTNDIGNVADNFSVLSAGLRYKINEKLSVALIVDEPYGSDINYPGDSAVTALGGTQAIVDSIALTALARYKFNNNWSAHGGIRYQEIEADVVLGGNAYGPLNGYRAEFDSEGAFGFVVGAAFEKPEIALRVSLTYSSKITHDLPTKETIGGNPVALPGVTEVVAPESLNLEFQTGIAKDTLVFGSIRYARYSDTIVSPAFFDSVVNGADSGDSLTDLEDSTDIEIGFARRFNDQWSGSIAFGYESRGEDDLVSPLNPRNGAQYVSLGAKYQVNEQIALSGGIRYTMLGDAQPETGTPDTARANFDDNSAVSAGFKISYSF